MNYLKFFFPKFSGAGVSSTTLLDNRLIELFLGNYSIVSSSFIRYFHYFYTGFDYLIFTNSRIKYVLGWSSVINMTLQFVKTTESYRISHLYIWSLSFPSFLFVETAWFFSDQVQVVHEIDIVLCYKRSWESKLKPKNIK